MIAGAMSILQCFAAHAGIWAQDGDQWKYQKDDGTYAEYEWVQDSGDWYYCSRWGNMEKNTVIDGYYLGADGRMIRNQTQKIHYTVKRYTAPVICRLTAMRIGTYYKAQVTLYDRSYYSNDELQYTIGDQFWIRPKGVYGTVSDMVMSTNGEIVRNCPCEAEYPERPQSLNEIEMI